MSRTNEIEGIILSARRSGDSNKLVCCLTEEEILYAQVYGAYKGKSRNGANCEMFSNVRLYTYLNPVKNQSSIKDSVLLKTYSNIRSDLPKIFLASVMSELIEKTYAGGGEYKQMYCLLKDSFDYLDAAHNSRKPDYLLVQFLLRFLDYSGSSFLSGLCQDCGKGLGDDNHAGEKVFYSFPDGEILCAECRTSEAVSLSAGICRYIEFTSGKKLQAAAAVSLSDADRELLKALLVQHVQTVNNVELKSLSTGLNYNNSVRKL